MARAEMVPCKRCEGEGGYDVHERDHSYYWIPCEACDATGKVEADSDPDEPLPLYDTREESEASYGR